MLALARAPQCVPCPSLCSAIIRIGHSPRPLCLRDVMLHHFCQLTHHNSVGKNCRPFRHKSKHQNASGRLLKYLPIICKMRSPTLAQMLVSGGLVARVCVCGVSIYYHVSGCCCVCGMAPVLLDYGLSVRRPSCFTYQCKSPLVAVPGQGEGGQGRPWICALLCLIVTP